MAPPCTICVSAQRVEIDETLSLPKVSMRAVSRQFGIGRTALRNHMHAHLPRAVASRERSAAARGKATPRSTHAKPVANVAKLDSAESVVNEFRRLYNMAIATAEAAGGDARLALAATKEANSALQQIAKTFGLFGDDRPAIVLDQSVRITRVVSQLTDAQLVALATMQNVTPDVEALIADAEGAA